MRTLCNCGLDYLTLPLAHECEHPELALGLTRSGPKTKLTPFLVAELSRAGRPLRTAELEDRAVEEGVAVSYGTVRCALSRMADSGLLERLSPGLYVLARGAPAEGLGRPV